VVAAVAAVRPQRQLPRAEAVARVEGIVVAPVRQRPAVRVEEQARLQAARAAAIAAAPLL